MSLFSWIFSAGIVVLTVVCVVVYPVFGGTEWLVSVRFEVLGVVIWEIIKKSANFY